MGILPAGRFDQDLSQAGWIEGVIGGNARYNLGHAVAVAVVGVLRGYAAAHNRG
jgi:hypothetical protein